MTYGQYSACRDTLMERLEEAIRDAIISGSRVAYAWADFGRDGCWVEIETDRCGETTISINHIHESPDDREACIRLGNDLHGNMPDWQDVCDELAEDEKYGPNGPCWGLDPAFASWADYYRYRFGGKL